MPNTARTATQARPQAVILASVFVCPVTQQYLSGGSTRVVRDLARLLLQNGFEVCVAQKAPYNGACTLKDGVKVKFVRAALKSATDLLFVYRTRDLARNAALCIYGTPELAFPCYATNALAVHHGIWWDRPNSRSLSGWVRRCVQWIRSASIGKRVKAILCVDTNFINYLRSGGASKEIIAKCHYVPNYADLRGIRQATESDFVRRHQSRRLLYLRRFEEHRGPELFIQVCEHLRSRNIQFSARMIGSGSLTVRIRTRLAIAGLSEIVTVEERDLDDVLTSIDESTVSLVPSVWSEGTSLAAVESIALGVPVVATDVGGLANVVIPHFNGFIANANAANLAYYVECLLADEELYRRISKQCLSLREAFSYERWETSVQHVIKLAGLNVDKVPVPCGAADLVPSS